MILTITEDCEITLLCLSLEVLIELPHCRWSERNKHNPQFTKTYGNASYSSIFTHWLGVSFRKTNLNINSAERQQLKKLQYMITPHKQWRLAENNNNCTIIVYFQLSTLKQCLINFGIMNDVAWKKNKKFSGPNPPFYEPWFHIYLSLVGEGHSLSRELLIGQKSAWCSMSH